MSKKVIVIGAGIAGLTAAIYAQRSGFDVTLIEQHSIVGGMCTSWRRKGYLFEGAMHWLTGSSPNTEVHQIWRDTGALSDTVPVELYDPFSSVEHKGQVIHLYRDIHKTAEHLRAVSPEDAPHIRQLVKEVKKLSRMQMPIFDVKGVKAEHPKSMSLGFLLNMLPAMPTINRLGKLTCGEYVKRLTHPGIRQLLSVVPEEYAASSLVFTLTTLHTGDGGHPAGGSLPMVERMEQTFKDLGGNLLLNTKVEKVKIENGSVKGVILADRTLEADAVIVAQETIAALANLFDTPLSDPWLKTLRENTKSTVCTFVSIGVRAELPESTLPAWQLDTPITYAGETINKLGFYVNTGPGYAPEGGTALTTALLGDTYDFWKKAKEEGRYKEEKQALAEQISRALYEKYPQMAGKIEVIDIATPLTYERYTGAHHGSWMTTIGPEDNMRPSYPGTVEAVQGLYFAGHRLMPPGGLPSAAASGRQAAQLVCKQFDAVFR